MSAQSEKASTRSGSGEDLVEALDVKALTLGFSRTRGRTPAYPDTLPTILLPQQI